MPDDVRTTPQGGALNVNFFKHPLSMFPAIDQAHNTIGYFSCHWHREAIKNWYAARNSLGAMLNSCEFFLQ